MANEHSQIVPNMQPTATVADFKFWCQKVLPLVYDDSLSYYEVLNKMVVYLNQVIDNINADIENVEELEDDFLLLQEYVNNFFDDIDQLVTYAERAEAAETAALSSAASAAESASNSATSASNSASSASTAASMATSALNAKDAAVAAKTAAETALASAQTAATNAASSATTASGAAINAQTAASAASTSATLADAAAQTATSKATEATTAAETCEDVLESIPESYQDLSDTVELLTGNEPITFVPDYYIDVSGDTVDVTALTPSTSGIKYAVIECAEGDQFTITATGGQKARCWCFLDNAETGTVIRKCAANISCNNDCIYTPKGATILIVQAKDDEKSYYGIKNNIITTSNILNDTTALTSGLLKNPYFDIVPVSGSNERKISFRENRITVLGKANNTGSTYYTYDILHDHMYCGGNDTSMLTYLTADNFVPIKLTNTQNLLLEQSLSGLALSGSATISRIYVGTYNSGTGEIILADTTLNLGLSQSTEYRNFITPLTALIPQIYENQNIGLFFQSRSPKTYEEFAFNLRIESYYTNTSTRGSNLKPIATFEPTYIATRDYNVNDIILIGLNLYIVTAPIYISDQLIEGTNIAYKTIGDLITEILNSLGG